MTSIPFIRAAAIAPMRRWLSENGRDPTQLLERADLAWVPPDDPYLPVPLRCCVRFMVEIARAEGPDAPYRMVNGRGGFEIGLIGAAAFGEATMRAGLHRMARAMPLHCTHEIFTVTDCSDVLHVRDGWATDLGDAEARHLAQQYVTALIDMICSTIAAPLPCLSKVSMAPHPKAGLRHLRQWLGDRLHAGDGGPLDIVIPSRAADSSISSDIRKAALQQLSLLPPTALRAGPLLSDDVITLVTAMLGRTTPSVAQAAAAAGVSGRTLRRHLGQEGHSFSSLVEQTRARVALRRLREEPFLALNKLAKEIGYGNQATLSRAVQRWTGKTPRDWRRTGFE